MRCWLSMGVFLWAAGFTARTVTAQPAASFQFAQTAQGELGSAFIAAVSGGDKRAQQNFVTSRISEAGLKNAPAEVWLGLLQTLSRQSGGLEITNAAPENAEVLAITARSRHGHHWARFVLFSTQAQPDKLSDIFIQPILDPALERKSRLPNSKLSESAAVNAIKKHIQLRASSDHFSGVVLVAKRNGIILHQAHGLAEQSFKVPNTLATRFHLGSMDKMFTGISIAQLVEAGKLSFDDTLAKVLPDFPDRSRAEKITIHQLLTHTAGTGDFISNPEYRGHREQFRQIADYLPLIAREPPLFEPGARWAYSNSGYVLLGLVIEKLSGESYFDYVRNHIFQPADMKDTAYFELNEVVPNRATGYLRDTTEDPLGIDPRRSNVMFLGLKGNSAGGGYSTATDLWKFSKALRDHKLLKGGSTELVTSGKVEMTGSPVPSKYGYGFAAQTHRGKEVRGMSGGGANSGVNSSLEMFWDGSYTVIVVGNYDAPAAEQLNRAICEFLAGQ